MDYKLSDLFTLQMGKTPARANDSYWRDGTNAWVSISDLTNSEKYICTTKERITDVAVAESGIRLVPKDTVIMSFKLSIGKTAITSEPLYTNEAIMAFIPNGKIEILPEYCYYYFSSVNWNEGTNRAVMGTTLNKATLSEMQVSFPSLDEQRKAIESLNQVDRLISLRKQQLAKLDELIKARFVEMFGDIITNSKGWPVQPLGKLCTIVRGGSPRPIEQYLGGNVPWIKIGDATEGDNIYLKSTKEHIIQDGIKKSRLVKAGSLIFANCGVSLGFARIITFDGCIHDGWLAMEDIDERLNKVFLLQTLNQMTNHFRAIAPSGTQPNLNTAIMKAYQQIIPPLPLQQEFILFLEQVDKSKATVQKALGEAQLLFDSLMQQYFG